MGSNSKLVSAINRIIRGYFPKKITESPIPKKVSSASEKESTFIDEDVSIPYCGKKECEPSSSYRTPCSCVTKIIDAMADKFKDPGKFPKNAISDDESFHKFAEQTLHIGNVSPTRENIKIIEMASLYADTLNLQDFNLNHLLEIHRLVMIKDDQLAGQIRDKDVVIQSPNKDARQTPPPHELHEHLENYFKWFRAEINSETNTLIFAAMAKYHLLTIHPFGDGNGRTSRIILNAILRKSTRMPCWVTIPADEIAKYHAVLDIAQDNKNYNPYLAYVTDCIKRSVANYEDGVRLRKQQQFMLLIMAAIMIQNGSYVSAAVVYYLFLIQWQRG
ncbi:protein adenylyltransferase Fic-like [Planococcus citri]|uniref:protein adenylyltransferase Fic-like n=1 Tax=Planococcus citri TaxID=170843 RepID=UPI0031F98D39